MKFLAYLFCYAVYPFSFLFIRNNKKLAFGSFKKAFNDNAKYLFIYFFEHRKEFDAVWLSMSKKTVSAVNSMGLKAYFTLSPKGIWHALTSKYWFFNAYTSDIMYAFSGGATCVNLWHGVGLKRIEFNVKTGALANRYQKRKFKEVFYHPEVFRKPDWVLTSTPFQTKMFATAFRIPEERCLEFGYPRNEILIALESQRQEFIAKYETECTRNLMVCFTQKGYHKIFIYMPTWRDSQREIFIQSFDLEKMNSILQAQNSLLPLKPHANVFIDEKAFKNYSNVMLIDVKTDMYPILPYIDVLITDYSSILYDFILMEDKDVILYLYDYEEYVEDRELFYPFDENVVGKKVWSFDELCQCIETGDYHIDEPLRQTIVEKFWGKTMDASPCQRLVSLVAK